MGDETRGEPVGEPFDIMVAGTLTLTLSPLPVLLPAGRACTLSISRLIGGATPPEVFSVPT